MNSMIQTIDLTKKFGDFTANDHINLDVKEQEIKCIVGENGAGKSTMMNMLYGLLQPTSGKILIRGKEVTMNSPTDAIANGIGMVHQHFKLVPSLTVYENILLGADVLCEHFQSAFCSCICRYSLASKFTHHRADVDDLSVSFFFHSRNHCFGNNKWCV